MHPNWSLQSFVVSVDQYSNANYLFLFNMKSVKDMVNSSSSIWWTFSSLSLFLGRLIWRSTSRKKNDRLEDDYWIERKKTREGEGENSLVVRNGTEHRKASGKKDPRAERREKKESEEKKPRQKLERIFLGSLSLSVSCATRFSTCATEEHTDLKTFFFSPRHSLQSALLDIGERYHNKNETID